MTKRQQSAIDREVERIYYQNCSGVEIDVMDIGKVFAAGRAAALAGSDIATAVLGKVAEVRKN